METRAPPGVPAHTDAGPEYKQDPDSSDTPGMFPDVLFFEGMYFCKKFHLPYILRDIVKIFFGVCIRFSFPVKKSFVQYIISKS